MRLAVGLVLLGVVSVQFGAAIAKSLFDEAAPTTIVWLRLATSALVLTLFVRPVVRGRSRQEWLLVAAFGLALATMNWAICESFSRIPLGIAITIELAGPLLLAVVLSRRAGDLIWIGLAAVGVALLGLEPGDLTAAGVGFAVLAGAAWAAYIVLAARVGRSWEGLDGLAMASVVALVVLSPLTIAGHGSDLASGHLWLVGAAVGMLSSVIPYSAEMVALRTISPAVFGVLVSLDPAAAALSAWGVLGETLSWVQWAAIAFVVVASIGMTRSGHESLSHQAS